MTQAQMADVLGISQSTLSRYETCGISDVEELERVWKILKCKPIMLEEQECDETLMNLIKQYTDAVANVDINSLHEARYKIVLYFLPSPLKKFVLKNYPLE